MTLTLTGEPLAPWHKASFDRFISERLPALLAERVPLAGYQVESTGPYTCRITVGLSAEAGEVEVEYVDVPQPNQESVFEIDGVRRVVVPTASCEDLDRAEVRCVGEQLYDYVEARLGEAPSGLPWDPSLARAWLPLDVWIREFLTTEQETDASIRAFFAAIGELDTWRATRLPIGQVLDESNWLARQAHLRRLMVPGRERLFAPGQLGRTCPFETPEGIYIGRVLSIAIGAEIRDGKLVVVEDAPEATLGLTASMVPLLEHNDSNRQLMGVNMMRQWLTPPDPEPALVQSGNEPDTADFWCGRNLLTAFVSWGIDTYEDAILVSESCAERLGYVHPLEAGDKLSNRHGTKGTVSRIVPDDEMPHLPDGTPVELVFSFMGCHTRLNFGQIREAVLGRIARADGEPMVIPPFRAPSEDEIRRRLSERGLPASGMEVLTCGKDGATLGRPSTVGWVYWGKTFHLARDKIHSIVNPPGGLLHGESEYCVLRDQGAFETIGEHFNTRASGREDAASLADRVAAGPLEQAPPPTPAFADLSRRLAAAGIATTLGKNGFALRFANPDGKVLELACAVPHPWSRDRHVTTVGVLEELPEYHAVVESNAKLKRIVESNSPESLRRSALEDLERRVREFFDALVAPQHLRFTQENTRVLFSGRTVISPGARLRFDQVGVPDEIAWSLFGPLVARKLGREAANVERCNDGATEELDAILEHLWVVVFRAPGGVAPTPFLAFRPLRVPGNVVRLHPLACRLMNADHDGDQVAVMAPITKAGQCEAGERLSLAGHLRRDPDLIKELFPPQESLWGLAYLSLTESGRREIADLAGIDVATPEGRVNRASMIDALRRLVDRDGIERTLQTVERLMRRGFEAAKQSGASLSPFFGETIERPAEPGACDAKGWDAYRDELTERFACRTDFSDTDVAPQVLAVKCGARGGMRHLATLVGSGSTLHDLEGNPVCVSRGFRDGLAPAELFAWTVRAREAIGQTAMDVSQLGQNLRRGGAPTGFNLLARAKRAERPGIVFALAAASGEVDPLTDFDSRLFVGLPVKASQ